MILNNTKKIIPIIICLCLSLSLLSGCGTSKNNTKSDKLNIVVTIYPEYQWVKAILGTDSNANITTLINKGADLHSFQPSAMDIMKIKNSDLFVYVGGESDTWAEDIVSSNNDIKSANLLSMLGDKAKEEETLEGMQAEKEDDDADDSKDDDADDADSDDSKDVDDDNDEEKEYDEHVWLSIKNTIILCSKLEKQIENIDPDNKAKYRDNLDKYIKKLEKLDKQYTDTIAKAKNKYLVFGDRYPFKYLSDDYNLKCYAAFQGCSAESEASFDTITFLAKKVDELNLSNIMVIDNNDQKIAKTIIKNTKKKNQKVLTLNSMQAANIIDSSSDYISIMEDNLKIIDKALN